MPVFTLGLPLIKGVSGVFLILWIFNFFFVLDIYIDEKKQCYKDLGFKRYGVQHDYFYLCYWIRDLKSLKVIVHPRIKKICLKNVLTLKLL